MTRRVLGSQRYHLCRLALLALPITGILSASVVTIPDLSLSPLTQYYTDSIGGGIGAAALMTGGGHSANVGTSPNDDGFSGPIALGFTLHFFGHDYTDFYANNNGNISFGGGIPASHQTVPRARRSRSFRRSSRTSTRKTRAVA